MTIILTTEELGRVTGTWIKGRILMAVIFLVSFLHFAWTQLRG